jgi:hypothetical protein
MMKATAPIPLVSSLLDEIRQACAFVNSDDEENRLLLPHYIDEIYSERA